MATETATDTNYTATDQLGSPRVVTDQNGNVVSRRDFLPFGEEIFADGVVRTTANKYSLTGQDAVRQRFTGYQRDLETGLDFAEARYYNNSHGRFTAVDPLLASGKSANPQTFNRYLYVMNNPLILSDSKGLQAGTKDDIVSCRSNCDVSINKKTNTASGNGGSLIDLRVNSVNADVPTEISSPPATLGDHLLQLGSDTAVGAGGSLYNTFAGAVNTINYVANFIDGWPATGGPSSAFGYLPYYNYRTPGEQSAALATTLVTLYAGSMSAGSTSAPSFAFSESATTTSAVERMPVSALNFTDQLQKSRLKSIADSIYSNGVQEPIDYTVINGQNYILNGNHRAALAQFFGQDVPVQRLPLPSGSWQNESQVLTNNALFGRPFAQPACRFFCRNYTPPTQ